MKRTRIPLVEHPSPTSAGTFTADAGGELTKVGDWARPAPPAPEPEPEPTPKKSRKAS